VSKERSGKRGTTQGIGSQAISRRGFFKLGGQGAVAIILGGALGAGGAALGGGVAGAAPIIKRMRLAATDGFIKTPDGKSHYVFGFANEVVLPAGIAKRRIAGYIASRYKGKARLTAPNIIANQDEHLYVTLTNTGLVTRPDLDDSHTLHYHGFPNAIPLFDGVPDQTFAVPVNREFTYFYNLRECGTYPYHCHFEDVEHIQMGMVGTIIVRPTQGPNFAYNDGFAANHLSSTRFDREYVMFLSEMDSGIHKRLETVQEGQTDWTSYTPDYWLLNGRSSPDTLKPNGDASLPSQPVSSLIHANSGEQVLLRFNSLGYQEHAVEAPGVTFRVVGEDAKPLVKSPQDLSYRKNVLRIAPGTTVDAIFTAPQVSQPTTFKVYDRILSHLNSSGDGMMTEIRVRPSGLGRYTAQTGGPNKWPTNA
jgi:FtsP/CotA-like multicopper oxidase with cupredoxin domain